MLSELAQKATDMGIAVNPNWSDQYIKRKITMFEKENGSEAETAPTGDNSAKPADNGRVLVELLVNYCPGGDYEVVEAVDSIFPGVGMNNKLWAGTKVYLGKDEARQLVKNTIQVVEVYKDADGRNRKREVTKRKPLAQVEVEF